MIYAEFSITDYPTFAGVIIRSNNRLGKPDHGDNQMKEKDEDIALSIPEKTPNFRPIQ